MSRLCGTVHSLKSTYVGRFILDLYKKCIFLDFAARKRNTFSTPDAILYFLGKTMLDETLMMVVSDHGGYTNIHGECNGPNTECLSFTMTATMNVPLLLRGKISIHHHHVSIMSIYPGMDPA